jgi:hypothetical protein
MPRAQRKKIEMKYGFPTFTNQNSNLRLCDREKVIISDIWSFWYYAIKKKYHNGSQISFLNSLLDQAKFFFTAAEAGPIKSQPLLYYYSFLNFAKMLINMSNYIGQTKVYRHGVDDIRTAISFQTSEIKIYAIKSGIINVSAELYKALDAKIITSPLTIKVAELMRNCVGVHRTYCEIYNQKEDLYKLSDLGLYKNGLQLELEAHVQCTAREASSLRSCGYNINHVRDAHIWNEQFTLPNHNITRKSYLDFSTFLRDIGIWYFIGNNGYTYYLSSNSVSRYPQEFVIYSVMFYLGSITRYRPHLFDEMVTAKEQWLMSEFLKTQPKQFLYLSSAKLLSQDVLKAYSVF